MGHSCSRTKFAKVRSGSDSVDLVCQTRNDPEPQPRLEPDPAPVLQFELPTLPLPGQVDESTGEEEEGDMSQEVRVVHHSMPVTLTSCLRSRPSPSGSAVNFCPVSSRVVFHTDVPIQGEWKQTEEDVATNFYEDMLQQFDIPMLEEGYIMEEMQRLFPDAWRSFSGHSSSSSHSSDDSVTTTFDNM